MSTAEIGTLVKARMQIKATIEEKTKAMKESIEEETNKLKIVESAVLGKLNELGVESVKTEFGTAYKDLKESFTKKDHSALMDWVKETDGWDLLDIKINKPNARAFVKDHNGELPPGVGYSGFLTTKYRKPTKKPTA